VRHGDIVRAIMKRIAALGLVMLAALALVAGTASIASGADRAVGRRPANFAVGRTTVQYDDQGRTITATVFYPATGRATILDVEDAPRATKWRPYPLILFSHDLGAKPSNYQDLLHTWAQAGYVVAVPTYPPPTTSGGGDSGDDGEAPSIDLGERLVDATFVIDRMLDRVQGAFGQIVDRERIAAVGHSLGAVTTYILAFATEERDTRIGAAVALAGGLAGDPSLYFGGSAVPLLAIHGDGDTSDPIEGTAEVYQLAGAPKYFVTLVDGDHVASFVDPSNPGMGVVERTTLDFFRAYLDGDASAVAQLKRDGKVAGVAKIKGQS
jgi:predicted dienelactone hydrolase